MQILITGASGFVGSSLINYLSNIEDIQVDVLDLGQKTPESIKANYHWNELEFVPISLYDTIIHCNGLKILDRN